MDSKMFYFRNHILAEQPSRSWKMWRVNKLNARILIEAEKKVSRETEGILISCNDSCR